MTRRPRRRFVAILLLAAGLAGAAVRGQETARTPAPAPAPAGPEGPVGWFGKSEPLMRPHFVDEFPGLDLSGLSPAQRERFLHRANTEFCTCAQSGCHMHTLAYCRRVDPGCPRAMVMLRDILDQVTAPPATGAGPTGAAASSGPSR